MIREIGLITLGSVGIILYYFSILNLGLRPRQANQAPTGFQEFMSLSVTSIGVSLATFVGMLLGLEGISQNTQRQLAMADLKPAIERAVPQIQQIVEGTIVTNFQWGAAGAYVVSLILALVLWRRGGDNTDPAISNLGKSTLGLIGGALTVLLNL